jgi:hypothetical protein
VHAHAGTCTASRVGRVSRTDAVDRRA